MTSTKPNDKTKSTMVSHVGAGSNRAIQSVQRQQKTRDEIESIRARNRIEEVIARYIELQLRGRLLVARCPLHDDSNPSLIVYAHTQTWHCFGCDAGGDVFAFVERIEHLRFGEALRRLGSGTLQPPIRATSNAMAKAHLVPSMPAKDAPIQLTSEHFTVLTAAAEVYHAAIFNQPRMLKYLADRRIDLDTIRRYRIGYVTGNDLAKHLRFRGWDPSIAEDLGLLGPPGETTREFFRQRIVIPEIRNGKVIYLVGRATEKYQKAKYLTLSGASKPRYGLESIRGAREVFVVEGPFDLLTLLQWGYPTLALMGSHVKEELVDELRNVERIYVIKHPDEAGRRVACQLAENFGEQIRILPPLPGAKDPNELAKQPHAREMFVALIQKATWRQTARILWNERRRMEQKRNAWMKKSELQRGDRNSN